MKGNTMTQATLTSIAVLSGTLFYICMWIETKKITDRQEKLNQINNEDLPSWVYPTPVCKAHCPLMIATN